LVPPNPSSLPDLRSPTFPSVARASRGHWPWLVVDHRAVETVRAEVFVTGRVQGVGFRDFCRSSAARFGVGGFATNLPDGRVHVVAEGSRASLDLFVRELQRGPSLARVESVDVTWTEARGEFERFGVRRVRRDA